MVLRLENVDLTSHFMKHLCGLVFTVNHRHKFWAENSMMQTDEINN